jgi:thiol:disulfide interchange protein DsbA
MMDTRRRLATVSALILGTLVALGSIGESAAQQSPVRLNYEYRLIDAQPIATGGRIEVIEFFWYGCPYCNQLQTPLENWLTRKPADVELRRIPALFRDSWVPHARLFYTLEALGEVGRLHQTVYRAIHVDSAKLMDANTTTDWAARNGIDPTRWLAAYKSPEVDQKVEQARNATKAYGLEGTPSLVVDGRFLTSSAMTETVPGVIPILEDLIRLARERRAGK